MQQLLNSEQVSHILGVSVSTLAQWRFHKRYNLPYIKSGRLIRYKTEDVQAFIESRRKEGRSQDVERFQS